MGQIILERYAYGRGRADRWISMSVAKSVTSNLIGAAVKDGLIHSIDDPVVKYIPEPKGSAFDGVTIENLMTMSSGVRYNEDVVDLRSDVALAGGEEMVGDVPPLVAYAKRLDREAKPQGFTTHIARYVDDGLTIVILTNQGNCDPQRIVDEVAEIYLRNGNFR